MRWVALSLLLGAAACGFDGNGGGDGSNDPDGGLPDARPDEESVTLDTAEKMSTDATMNGTFVSTAGGASGSIEPIASLAQKLLIELDDIAGPYDGTWGSRPPANQLVGRNVMLPLFAGTPRGAPNDFIAWLSGEIRLDAGAQKVGLTVSNGAAGFVDILDDKGAELVHCPSTQAECNVTAPAAGWYPVRLGWRKPGGTVSNFQLRWAPTGGLGNIPIERLRAPMHATQLTGSRLEGFVAPRSLRPVDDAVSLQTATPIALDWNDDTFGLGQSSAYRTTTQLRIAEGGDYTFRLAADNGASYRLWLDGEWINAAASFQYLPDGMTTPPESINRTLTAGWHDLVLEGYDTRGTTGEIAFTFGKAGGTLAAPSLAATRPAIGAAPRVAHAENLQPLQLVSNGSIQRAVTIAPLAGTSPQALAVDVTVAMRPVIWNGITIKIYPPGVATGIPVTLDTSNRTNNNLGEVDGSLTKVALGNVPAQGEWKVEIFHPNAGGLNGTNTVSDVQLHVHYAGGAGVNTPPLVPTTSTYSRMFALDKATELRSLLAETITPPGTSVALSAQLCTNAQGTSCEAELTAAQLAAGKPTGQFVKVKATFTSDGFAVPIITKLVLRHVK